MRFLFSLLLIVNTVFAQEATDEVTLLKEQIQMLQKQNQEQQGHFARLYAMSFHQQALEYLRLKKYMKAISSCEKALEHDPKHIPSYECMGLSYIHLQDYKQAIEHFRKVLSIEPDHSECLMHLAEAYFFQKEYQQALEYFSKTLEFYPNLESIHYNRALTYMKLGQNDLALADFSWIIKNNPKSVAAYQNRGNIRWTKKQYRKSIDDYTKAIEINRNKIFHNYYDLRGYETSQQYDILLLQLHASYNNRSLCYESLGKYRQAIDDLSQAIALRPTHVLAYRNRARNLMALKKSRLAAEDLTKAIAIEKEMPLLYVERARAYKDFLDLQFTTPPLSTSYEANRAALNDYASAINLNPNDYDAYTEKAFLHYEEDQFVSAARCFTRAIRLKPQVVENYNNRGSCYYSLQKYEDAMIDYQKALQLRPKFVLAHRNMARVYKRLKKYRKAIEHWRILMDLQPSLKRELEDEIQDAERYLKENEK